MDKEQLLYQYFSNTLTAVQKEQFENLLQKDVQFKEQFDFEKNLQSVIHQEEAINLKSKLVGFEKAVQKETPVRIMRPNYQKWAMAASVALLLTLGWFGYTNFSGPNYNDMYDSNFQEYPNTVFTLTRSSSAESIERDAFVAYESKEYDAAIEKFNQIPSEVRQAYVDFYLAQSYLNAGNNAAAKEFFKKTIAKATNFVAESHWYLAMIALKEENKVDAEFELNKLINGHEYNREKAEALLSKLD